jgi:hypothetical protein
MGNAGRSAAMAGAGDGQPDEEVMRKRTQARELALQLMYQLDLRGDEILDEVNAALAPEAGDPEMLDFARELVHGCREKRAEIDRQIEEVAKNWQLKRMAAIDRNILRLGDLRAPVPRGHPAARHRSTRRSTSPRSSRPRTRARS